MLFGRSSQLDLYDFPPNRIAAEEGVCEMVRAWRSNDRHIGNRVTTNAELDSIGPISAVHTTSAVVSSEPSPARGKGIGSSSRSRATMSSTFPRPLCEIRVETVKTGFFERDTS
jgi:hypothetical protein